MTEPTRCRCGRRLLVVGHSGMSVQYLCVRCRLEFCRCESLETPENTDPEVKP